MLSRDRDLESADFDGDLSFRSDVFFFLFEDLVFTDFLADLDLLFDFDLTKEGPPFGGSSIEYLQLFSEKFNIPLDTYESIYYGDGLKNKEIKKNRFKFIDC